MDITINLEYLRDLENNNIKIDSITFQKMLLIFNSIDHGWCVKKKGESYVFSKPHENKKEVLEDNYIMKFMKTNLDINKLIS